MDPTPMACAGGIQKGEKRSKHAQDYPRPFRACLAVLRELLQELALLNWRKDACRVIGHGSVIIGGCRDFLHGSMHTGFYVRLRVVPSPRDADLSVPSVACERLGRLLCDLAWFSNDRITLPGANCLRPLCGRRTSGGCIR